MTLKQFRDLLLTVTDRVGHGEHFKDGGNYIVWHEVGKIGTNADNAEAESGFRIAVDYFTKVINPTSASSRLYFLVMVMSSTFFSILSVR